MNSQLLDRMRILLEFGPDFLVRASETRRLEEQLSELLRRFSQWGMSTSGAESSGRSTRDGLDELGYTIYNRRFAKAIAAKSLDLMLNPKATTRRSSGA